MIISLENLDGNIGASPHAWDLSWVEVAHAVPSQGDVLL